MRSPCLFNIIKIPNQAPLWLLEVFAHAPACRHAGKGGGRRKRACHSSVMPHEPLLSSPLSPLPPSLPPSLPDSLPPCLSLSLSSQYRGKVKSLSFVILWACQRRGGGELLRQDKTLRGRDGCDGCCSVVDTCDGTRTGTASYPSGYIITDVIHHA